MKTAVALLALVVVAGLVECAPSLKEKLLKLKEAKRGRGEKGGDGQKSACEEPDWPFAWIELVSLVGKCEAGRNFLEYADIDPELAEGVLAKACPRVLEEVSKIEDDMDEQTLKMVTGILRKAFPLMQCVNLQADRESLLFWSALNEASSDEFETGAAPLFALCKEVFDTVAKMEAELEKDVQDAEEAVSDNSRRQLLNTMRELISYAKRR